MMNKYWIFLHKNKILFFVLFAFIAMIFLIWWQHMQTEQQNLTRERERVGNALRQAGKSSAHQQLPTNAMKVDGNAPHELSDEAELAQAKLWYSLPSSRRAILQSEMTQAGLAAKSDYK